MRKAPATSNPDRAIAEAAHKTVGATRPRQRRIEHAFGAERQRAHDPPERIDHRGDAGIGGAHQRQAFLDRAHARLLQVLVGPVLMPNQPSLVRLSIQPGRSPAGTASPGKIDLVADQRQECAARRGNADRLARRSPGMKPPRTLVSCISPRLLEEILKRQIFAERHEMHLVVDRQIEPS